MDTGIRIERKCITYTELQRKALTQAVGFVVPRTAPASFLTSTVALASGPCNRERSVPFYHSYNTSPWIGFPLLGALVVRDGTLP
jgi:hypothetical protein